MLSLESKLSVMYGAEFVEFILFSKVLEYCLCVVIHGTDFEVFKGVVSMRGNLLRCM